MAIDEGDYDTSSPQVAMNPDGYAMVVWLMEDDDVISYDRISANIYEPGSGWR